MKKKPTNISKLCKKTTNYVLDLLWPKFCVNCQKEGTYLCQKCQKEIIAVICQNCPHCGRISENGRYCQKCKKEKFLSGVIVSAYYEGPVKEIIHNFKYNGVTELKIFLSVLLVQAYFRQDMDIDLVTFTPLHFRRLAFRGYNQSELLAQEIGRKINLPVENLLIKTKNTKRQVGLVESNRRKNLEKVFQVRKVHKVKSLKGKKILIIDDILTTGTTLNECAKVLKAAGAKEVWGLVVARG